MPTSLFLLRRQFFSSVQKSDYFLSSFSPQTSRRRFGTINDTKTNSSKAFAGRFKINFLGLLCEVKTPLGKVCVGGGYFQVDKMNDKQ